MSAIIIRGGRPLSGSLTVQGAKNSVLPILAATLLSGEVCRIRHCPRLRDVETAMEILRHLGCRADWQGRDLLVDAADLTRWDVPDHLMSRMRSSVVFLGAILARCGQAEMTYPGGCELGARPIDLLYFHRPDPKVPYNESVEAIKQLVDEGVAQEAGISNASIEQIDIARGILGDKLVAVQNQYSPIHLETQDTLDYCAKVGLAFVCWSPLGGYRHPYDETKFDPFREVAAAHGVSYQQVVLAWELAKGDHMFVIPGAHRPETILDSLKADQLELTPEELAKLG